jgi:hypothetical protein
MATVTDLSVTFNKWTNGERCNPFRMMDVSATGHPEHLVREYGAKTWRYVNQEFLCGGESNQSKKWRVFA